MQELFTIGKTKQKVIGFVSKAGNTFDACLKYADEKIVFDFDNAGENKADNTQMFDDQAEMPWLHDTAQQMVMQLEAEEQ